MSGCGLQNVGCSCQIGNFALGKDAGVHRVYRLRVAQLATRFRNDNGPSGLEPKRAVAGGLSGRRSKEGPVWTGVTEVDCPLLVEGRGGGPGGICTLRALVRRPRPTLCPALKLDRFGSRASGPESLYITE